MGLEPEERPVVADGAPDNPVMRPYTQSLPLALLRARESVMSRLRPVLRDHDVTEQQWRTLRTLAEVGEVEVTMLAGLICLLPSSLSRILRDLAGRGLIQRRTSEEDMRRGLVSILPAGLDLIRRVSPKAAGANLAIEMQFGAARLAALKVELGALCEILGGGEPGED
ncbi:homoprotocatechuate degradation operon regulator HpaR [Niveispirillum sp. KHB5.9]|uniref:homoprotocatechuate degradation operon regulator HpaR n=1 Tax=Niveispirillum sp. KHB5.9 TaxID=3400269 RepID=UPI003A8C6D18